MVSSSWALAVERPAVAQTAVRRPTCRTSTTTPAVLGDRLDRLDAVTVVDIMNHGA
ncbi:hypothetical protein [Dactylosporangium salmoneum]|uniref:hypothetical protein n=1 Tax=Dactylosporangium salmoneum TaxID=53361 RepID=UPI0031E223C2